MNRPLRLVILNDDVEATKRLAASISIDGVVVYSTDDPDEACQLISLLQHEVMLIDVEKLICTPAYPLESFREANPTIKIVGISRAKRGDTGLLLQLLDLDAYIHEPLTPEALITALPEITDRYLVQSAEDTSRQSHADQARQKWGLNLFVPNRRSPSPQV